MFGISPLGWLHTLGSLPAIPLALYMLARHGRIAPRTIAGKAYLVFMLIGALTVFPVAHQSASHGIAVATIVLLLTGYGIAHLAVAARVASYIETVCLSLTVFLLMVPSVSETLRRVPDGHPLVTDPKSPLLLAALACLFVMLLAGLTVQIIALRRRNKASN